MGQGNNSLGDYESVDFVLWPIPKCPFAICCWFVCSQRAAVSGSSCLSAELSGVCSGAS